MGYFEYDLTSPARRLPATIEHVEDSAFNLYIRSENGQKQYGLVQTSPEAVARARNLQAPPRANYSWFMLEALKPGVAHMTAYIWHPGPPKAYTSDGIGPITINVLPKLVLPPASTDAGLLARLFLAETMGPLMSSSYTLAGAKLSMRLMHLVVANRLKTPSAQWGSAHAKSLQDVVRAAGQFAGFGNYPTLAAAVDTTITSVLNQANQGSNPHLHTMRDFVQAALDEAAVKNPADPSSTGLYWWRTAGSGAPSKTVKPYQTVLGNTFYMK